MDAVDFEDAVKEYKEIGLMVDRLPIKFPNGNTVTTIGCVCSNCGKDIKEENVKGTVVIFPAHLASLRGWAGCFECGSLNRVDARIRATGEGLVHEAMINGEWQSSQFTKVKVSFMDRLKKFIGVKV